MIRAIRPQSRYGSGAKAAGGGFGSDCGPFKHVYGLYTEKWACGGVVVGGIMAVAITAALVADAVGTDVAIAARLLPVATGRIASYLKGGTAPAGVEDEAAVLFIGYLAAAEGTGAGAVMESSVGPLTSKTVTDHSAAFRRSGAAGLLTPYRRRRGGVI